MRLNPRQRWHEDGIDQPHGGSTVAGVPASVWGAILSLAASEADVGRGTVLLGAYAVGLGIPFLLVAAFFPRLKGVMGWMKRHMRQIEATSGLLLWTVGLMMLTGQFSALSFWLLESFPILQRVG